MSGRFSCIALATFFAIVPCVLAGTFEPPVPSGSPPNRKEWVWIQVADVEHYMLPILYFSTGRFRTRVPEVLIVLPPKSYQVVATLTADQVTRPGCPTSWTPPFARYSVAITERRGGQTLRCVLPQSSACDYLNDLKGSGKIHWTPKMLDPIGHFVRYLGCDRISGRTSPP
jgi:hypothetical protein